ncbi:dihydropteroate synthase [Lasius niger]|uniref:Dihydropteroate synthase n=1 Tax=Lasius niger TaxID=67767 RepID=A0A0J7KH71_LASNI|nr:dihydropteroate synthase [Lasius niger]
MKLFVGYELKLFLNVVSHTWIFQGEYPHWKTNTTWDQNPPAIANDKCAIKWTRNLYFCNGPKSTPTIPLHSLVLLPSNESPPPSPVGTLFLQRRSTELPYPGATTFGVPV